MAAAQAVQQQNGGAVGSPLRRRGNDQGDAVAVRQGNHLNLSGRLATPQAQFGGGDGLQVRSVQQGKGVKTARVYRHAVASFCT